MCSKVEAAGCGFALLAYSAHKKGDDSKALCYLDISKTIMKKLENTGHLFCKSFDCKNYC